MVWLDASKPGQKMLVNASTAMRRIAGHAQAGYLHFATCSSICEGDCALRCTVWVAAR